MTTTPTTTTPTTTATAAAPTSTTAPTRSRGTLLAAAALVTLGLLALLLALLPRGRADAGAIEAANALVQSGRTAEAIRLYESLVAEGVRDNALYYNLGVAYFAQGDAARAAAAFGEALALAPRDADTRANLKVALAAAPEAAPIEPGGPLGFLAGLTDGWLSLDEIALLTLLLWLVVCALWLVGRGRGGRWARRAMIVALLALVFFGVSFVARLVM